MPPRRSDCIATGLTGLLLGWVSAMALAVGVPVAATALEPGGRLESMPPVLRVGVVDGAPPCSYRDAGDWRGLAVDLWGRIATRERLPYVVSEWPSVQAMLEASRNGALDVAVGCINVSPDRLERYRFSLPFQEDGLAVMVLQSRLDLGRSFLSALLTPTLLQLLGGYLAAIGLLALLTWRVEHYAQQPQTLSHGRLRSFSAVFQVLATGPGSNALVTTTRGNGIVLMAYLVRIVSASLLVGYLTVNVARQVQGTPSARIRSEGDLRGLRVAVRSGTVSESLLRELNAGSSAAKATIVPLTSIRSGVDLLVSRRVDAVLGDNLQLRYLLINAPLQGSRLSLALQGIRPESQAFALAPGLPAATAERIDRAISALKRNGVVTVLRQRAGEPADSPAR
ncbi:ABC transporter substrate-binding protein [Synechococcus sp. RedBA-s]|uniref:substrate-binding periplasmic protein n=1 Tax=Synechococcus sp. RedBA-s TaxID=2823741 RepID=UPI0020CCD0FD|nr:transporter substrate-binding domain-containing protein [Synechococcus sp. RedBA-s]MCP9800228.1 transporter substrate-binding domain-containing protein [Synechococcus sp. RedBA-s]